jgi:DNA-binding NtrC family response regulator
VRERQQALPAELELAAIIARADALAGRGRHAGAARLLRESAGALARRRAFRDAVATLVRLGCLLSERGRAAEAARAFSSAVQIGDSRTAITAEARVWLASAKADMRQLAEAEAMCRELRHALSGQGGLAEWATAMLARVSLWQGRVGEARTLVDGVRAQRAADAPSAFVQSTAVRVLLADGDFFGAGHRLRSAFDDSAGLADPLVRLLATAARLRFHAATGDLGCAEHDYRAVQRLARTVRAPLREVRAGLDWVEALGRAQRATEAARELARLRRLGRLAAPLLRHRLEQTRIEPARIPSTMRRAAPLVEHLAAVAESCRTLAGDSALAQVLRQVSEAVGARRIDVVSRSGVVLCSVGGGPGPTLGAQALEAGTPAGPLELAGGQEVAVPIRWDDQVAAALVARWDHAPERAAPWLLAAASILATPVQAQLRRSEDEARCATLAPGLLGRSPAMAAVRAAVARAGPAPFAVLIHGESGVGKELVARAVHALSARHNQRMCDVNCAALPDDLLESELFGYVRGAFTGALGDRVGLFEDAHGGTLFLDEVVELSARAQAKLLRVLQQQEVRRLGETRTRHVDVRVVSAANRDPREAAAAGTFRPDLVYRLDVIRISVPPLRERREDVADLAHHFWQAAAARVGSHAALGREAVDALAAYDWPGNVRELQNVLAAMAVAAPRDGRMGPQHLPPHVTGASSRAPLPPRLHDARRECDRQAVLAALALSAGHRGRAARQLGLSRQGLLKLMVRLGLPLHPRPEG